MTSITQTVTESLGTLRLRPESPPAQEEKKPVERPGYKDLKTDPTYKYAWALPHFNDDHYPPLTEFEHKDPGLEALKHENPREFLAAGQVSEVSAIREGFPFRNVADAGHDSSLRGSARTSRASSSTSSTRGADSSWLVLLPNEVLSCVALRPIIPIRFV